MENKKLKEWFKNVVDKIETNEKITDISIVVSNENHLIYEFIYSTKKEK